MSAEAKTASAVNLGVIAASTMLNVITASLTSTSLQGVWTILNYFQLLLLLLLTGAYFPLGIRNFFAGISPISFSFNFIPVYSMSFIEEKIENLNFNIVDDVFEDIGFVSGSVIVNNLSFFFILIGIALVHSIF